MTTKLFISKEKAGMNTQNYQPLSFVQLYVQKLFSENLLCSRNYDQL